MEFLGSELGTLARVVVAILVVLGLIALTIWLIRRYGPVTFTKTGVARGRQPRLALLESATVDARRRLVLIRRDNVEHLLLVGGPTDVVVEPNIVRAATMQTLAAPMPGAAREPIARAAGPPAMLDPEEENATSLVPPSAPAVHVPTPQPAAELPAPPPPAQAPEPRPAPAPVPRIDPQYAEMAQRLEAALRRPPEARPVPPPMVAHPSAAPARIEPTPPPMPQAPEPNPATMAPPTPKTPEPRMPKPSALPPPAATAPAAPPPKPTPKRDVFDNLEEEMANLLGRGDKKAS